MCRKRYVGKGKPLGHIFCLLCRLTGKLCNKERGCANEVKCQPLDQAPPSRTPGKALRFPSPAWGAAPLPAVSGPVSLRLAPGVDVCPLWQPSGFIAHISLGGSLFRSIFLNPDFTVKPEAISMVQRARASLRVKQRTCLPSTAASETGHSRLAGEDSPGRTCPGG